MSDHTINDQATNTPEKKKLSLEEMVKQKLASKKQAQNATKLGGPSGQQTQKMKSQMTKKPSNTRRKMGV
ncbi:hypothetical protein PY093_03950 [Cytobacillus sp. S13-E01]|uniref:hypothetical protein n=1 Tax=Cytobacillus sp. S13-E01 TaxID=3031326 RepID=UPI0023D81712|nr:hypothetical protein [Cytobacillus sp. S13-E01]MDF0725867.1 hypothetical protein [Cytobacillus sp. S13-E01]